MTKWYERVKSFLKDDDGPTAVEYAVMLALIIAVCFVAISTLGKTTSSTFSNGTLNNALGGST